MSGKRIAVLVSGGGTNLQALLDAQALGEIRGGEIAAVLSSKEGAYALKRAAKAGIPGYVAARKSFPDNRAMTRAILERHGGTIRLEEKPGGGCCFCAALPTGKWDGYPGSAGEPRTKGVV